MRYAQIRELDISNGSQIGVSLFVQGCDIIPHCKGCFNSDTWDFNGGREWTKEVEEHFLNLIDRPYIKRVSILGGEPLARKNIDYIYHLILKIKDRFPDKIIWLYTGYEADTFFNIDIDNEHESMSEFMTKCLRKSTASLVDVLVEGPYIEKLKDQHLNYRGSSNQRVIDVQETLKQGRIVLYCD